MGAVAPVRAQDDGEASNENPEAPSKLRDIVAVDTDALPDLPALLQRYPTALTLQVTRAQLQPSPHWPRLRDWVQRGGVIFLHNDAAQLFGYDTVAARPATPQQAGQLFGRAVAAWPWGAQPLLNGPRPVETVFYQMQLGDHLVSALNGATPPVARHRFGRFGGGRAECATVVCLGNSAVWSRLGGVCAAIDRNSSRRWCDFSAPSCGNSPPNAPARPRKPIKPLTKNAAPNAPPKERAQTYLAIGPEILAVLPPNAPPTSPAAVDFAALQKNLDALLESASSDETAREVTPPNREAPPTTNADKAKPQKLMLFSEEVDAMAQLASRAAAPEATPLMRARALARLEIWRARWELQQPGGGAALDWLQTAAQQIAPDEADAANSAVDSTTENEVLPEQQGIAFWRGVIASASALSISSDARIDDGFPLGYRIKPHLTPDRAQMWQDTANAWQQAARARPQQLFALTGLQTSWLQNWAIEANRRADSGGSVSLVSLYSRRTRLSSGVEL